MSENPTDVGDQPRTDSQPVDASQFDNGDNVRITLDGGDILEGMVAGCEHDEANDYSSGWSRLTLEGDWFDQVTELGSETEVLHLRQSFTRQSGDPQTATLEGRAWPNGGDYDDGEVVELGKVVRLERQGSDDGE